MKKLLFGVQVFGLIVALPLYAFLELNHGAESQTIAEKSSHTTEVQDAFVLKLLVETTAGSDNQKLVAIETSNYNYHSKK